MTTVERENYDEALEVLIRHRDALNVAIAAIQRHLEADPAPTPALPTRCPHCQGVGYIAETGEYCQCQLGRDLRRVEERSKQTNEETQTV